MAACAGCGAELAADAGFCSRCGRPAAFAGHSGDIAQPTPSTSQAAPDAAPGGWGAAGIALGACALVSLVGWEPLSGPSRALNALVPSANCANVPLQSPEMYACSIGVAALALAGPVALMVLLFFFRASLARAIRFAIPRIPQRLRFLVAPLVATLVFTIVWAGVHYDTAGRIGLVPQRLFPAFVGLFTWATVSHGPRLQRRLRLIFRVRDVFPRWLRLVVVMLVPMALAYYLTNQERVTQPALKEQVVALVSMGAGWLAMVPRGGDVLAGVRRFVEREGRQT